MTTDRPRVCRCQPAPHGVPRLAEDAPRADQEGLHLRPGGALVPRLRRLRDPRRRAGLPARARPQAREHRLRLGHRLLARASRTTSTPTACTRSTGARRPSPPAWPPSRADLSVWVVTGDGDALSIGGNHLIHALRRNVNLTILLFNNQIYGLTKGQYSPTSEVGKVTKSTPARARSTHPFNPVSLALGAEATFVARTMDSDRKHLTERPAGGRRAPRHGAGRDLPELPDLQRRRLRRAQGPRRGAGPASCTSPTASRSRVGTRRRSSSATTPATLDVVVAEAEADPARVRRRARRRRRRPVAGVRALPARRPEHGARADGHLPPASQRPTYDDLVRDAGRRPPSTRAGGPATDADLADLLHGTRHLDRRVTSAPPPVTAATRPDRAPTASCAAAPSYGFSPTASGGCSRSTSTR